MWHRVDLVWTDVSEERFSETSDKIYMAHIPEYGILQK
jgi:hypothetical protein